MIIKHTIFAATDPASTSEHSQGSRSPAVLLGSFSISEQDDTFSDLSRVSYFNFHTSILSWRISFREKDPFILNKFQMTCFSSPFFLSIFQVFSAVLDSLGIAGVGSGSEGVNLSVSLQGSGLN